MVARVSRLLCAGPCVVSTAPPRLGVVAAVASVAACGLAASSLRCVSWLLRLRLHPLAIASHRPITRTLQQAKLCGGFTCCRLAVALPCRRLLASPRWRLGSTADHPSTFTLATFCRYAQPGTGQRHRPTTPRPAKATSLALCIGQRGRLKGSVTHRWAVACLFVGSAFIPSPFRLVWPSATCYCQCCGAACDTAHAVRYHHPKLVGVVLFDNKGWCYVAGGSGSSDRCEVCATVLAALPLVSLRIPGDYRKRSRGCLGLRRVVWSRNDHRPPPSHQQQQAHRHFSPTGCRSTLALWLQPWRGQ